MFKKIFIIIILLTFLNACSNATSTMTQAVPIASSPSLTATFQSTPIPTLSPIPTATPNPNKIKLQTTQQALDKIKSMFPEMCESNIMKSPDGNWLAQDCLYDSLKIIKMDGTAKWEVKYLEIFGDSEYYPQIAGGISPKYWTIDSQYLYFSIYSCCRDPLIMILSGTETLYKMRISDGKYSLTRKGYFDFSFSPTDRRATFIEELVSPLIVEIQELKSGMVSNVKLNVDNEHNQAKVDAWSSDGLRFAVKTVSGINYSHKVFYPDKFSLIVIDVNDLSQKFIVKDVQTIALRVVEWTENNILIFQTGDEAFSEPVVTWQYDLNTDTLTTPAANP